MSNFKTTVEALPQYISKKSEALFTKHSVFSKAEIHARYDILTESYSKTIAIEALAMIEITMWKMIPACIAYQSDLASLLQQKKACGINGTSYNTSLEDYLLGQIADLSAKMLENVKTLEKVVEEAKGEQKVEAQAALFGGKVVTAMSQLRLTVDELEGLVSDKHWPLPSYTELLYSVV